MFLSVVWGWQSWGSGDATVYLAAGERLNAGHDLYALVPGDRVVEIRPPYWTVPILSPPIVGILWQPLAALPAELGPVLWAWAATLACAATILVFARRRPVLVGPALVALGLPLGVLMWSGNVDAFRLPATVAVWYLATRVRQVAAGVIVGFMIAVKLTPALLVVWLLVTGARRGAVSALVTAIGITALAVLLVGLAPHLRYLDVIRNTVDVGTAEMTLAGLARDVGVAPDIARWLPELAVAISMVATILLRRTPGASFAASTIGQVLGAPATGLHTFGLLLAALAPAVFPLGGEAEAGSAETARVQAGSSEGTSLATGG